ncbi:tryptophan-rich sensory protein [Lysinibacillus sp. KU-BSD001]|uniref:tryptophan-rich sensory protein n=1 Tax=Lysinibacillus sp. KU-BSD001 TaxID=3141328 RepID=UPI0036EF5F73
MVKWISMVIAYIAMITVNVLSNTLPINGKTTQEISSSVNSLFTPANYVFSIWNLIYLLLAIWLLIAFINRQSDKAVSDEVAHLFILSCLLNIGWIISFHYERFILSTVIIILLLITLILIYVSYPKDNNSLGGRLPFSIYLGWVSVATIASISFTLKYYDVTFPLDEVTITIILIIFAGLLAIIGLYVSNDVYFALVFVWAIIGIGVANSDMRIVLTSYAVAAAILTAILVMSFRSKNKIQQVPV